MPQLMGSASIVQQSGKSQISLFMYWVGRIDWLCQNEKQTHPIWSLFKFKLNANRKPGNVNEGLEISWLKSWRLSHAILHTNTSQRDAKMNDSTKC